MGNCLGGDTGAKNAESTGSAIGTGGARKSDGNSLHQGILRERNVDVNKKYIEIEVLGQGSMGHVAKVQIRDGEEGGSAFKAAEKKKFAMKNFEQSSSSGLSEKRKTKVDYALKSIQLDRVSPMFLEELKNEIDILKGMVR